MEPGMGVDVTTTTTNRCGEMLFGAAHVDGPLPIEVDGIYFARRCGATITN